MKQLKVLSLTAIMIMSMLALAACGTRGQDNDVPNSSMKDTTNTQNQTVPPTTSEMPNNDMDATPGTESETGTTQNATDNLEDAGRNLMDSIKDAGDAIKDGVNEITNTGN